MSALSKELNELGAVIRRVRAEATALYRKAVPPKARTTAANVAR